MQTAQDVIDQIKRHEANLSLRERLANRKRTKAEYRKSRETIAAMRIWLERKMEDEGK